MLTDSIALLCELERGRHASVGEHEVADPVDVRKRRSIGDVRRL